MKFRTSIAYAFASLFVAALPLQPARAEISEVRLAQQFSMGYLQFAMQGS